MGDLVFFEQLRHFFCHHSIIILNGDEGNFFSRLGLFLRRGLVGLFGLLTHSDQYTPEKARTVALFKGFQRRFLRKLPLAVLAGH
ncbi:MAG: hypothetical protein KF890_11275, partial [Nitrospira sp.]|nr:hypothetical protein [Nitrospira sp.]